MVVLCSLLTQQGVALAQARELGNPRAAAPSQPAAPQADEFGDTLPSAPRDQTAMRPRSTVRPVQVARPAAAARDAQGRIHVRFEGDSHRGLVVTQLLTTSQVTIHQGIFNEVAATGRGASFGLVCRLACDAYLDPGAYQFGVGRDAYPDYRTAIIQISRPTQINVHYDDHGVLRIIGMITMLVGVGAGILAFWSFVQDEPDYALAGAVGGGLGILTGLGLLFASDGVHFSAQPLR
jgi:hypothetical protein